MEQSEIQERVINLGKALVQELGLEPGVDSFSRWMAHYIAEQIAAVENTAGDEKAKAQQRCFETILTLWQHHSSLPNGHRPFENFEPIFRTLNGLDPENPQPFYRYWQKETDDELESPASEIKEWIDLALGIDSAARVLIDFAVKQAAANAVDEKTSAWLRNAANLTDADDITVIRLISGNLDEQHSDNPLHLQKQQKKSLKSKIEKLEAFLELSQAIRLDLIDDLERLS
jgi:hypothetical protein